MTDPLDAVFAWANRRVAEGHAVTMDDLCAMTDRVNPPLHLVGEMELADELDDPAEGPFLAQFRVGKSEVWA